MLKQMLPCSSVNDVFDGRPRNAVYYGHFSLREMFTVFAYLHNSGFRQFGLIVALANGLASTIFHVFMVLLRCPFDNVARVEAKRRVANMARLRCRPMSMSEQKGQPMRRSVFAVVSTFAIPPIGFTEWPNQAFVGLVFFYSYLKPNPLGGMFLKSSEFPESISLARTWSKLLDRHFRSLTAMVLGWGRCSERPSSFIIQATI
jgi:hypothetical protein